MCLAIQTEAVMEPQIDNQLYDIPGFEGLYKITRDGKIYGVRQKRWRRDLKPIELYTKHGEYIKTFQNSKQASEETGIKRQYIVDVCNGKQKTTGGYIFKYTTNK